MLVSFIIIGLAVGGCSKAWMSHDTIYKTYDHLAYSLWGYNDTSAEDLKQSNDEGWWGEPIPYP